MQGSVHSLDGRTLGWCRPALLDDDTAAVLASNHEPIFIGVATGTQLDRRSSMSPVLVITRWL